jgi:DNA-directed RNA polymerase subunit RPC12/RpoP
MSDIDTDCTPEVVCPYCGAEGEDSWDLGIVSAKGSTQEDSGETECAECDKTFSWSREVRVDYTTRKIEESKE